jgi:hypothetical protein
VAIGAQLSGLSPGERSLVQRPDVDICFVFDTTGSMSNKIEGLIQCMTEFVDELGKMALDWRTTVVPFGDLTVTGDRVDAQLPFVADVTSAKGQLRTMQRFSGGANQGESSIDAMLAGLGKPWRQGVVKVIILLTDEPALGAEQAAGRVDEGLSSSDVICFVASVPEQYYQSWASSHGESGTKSERLWTPAALCPCYGHCFPESRRLLTMFMPSRAVP